jgi:hypothetical protein
MNEKQLVGLSGKMGFIISAMELNTDHLQRETDGEKQHLSDGAPALIGLQVLSTPQLFRVDLNAEQAILTSCSITTMALSNGGNMSCHAGVSGCKRFTGAGGVTVDHGCRREPHA